MLRGNVGFIMIVKRVYSFLHHVQGSDTDADDGTADDIGRQRC